MQTKYKKANYYKNTVEIYLQIYIAKNQKSRNSSKIFINRQFNATKIIGLKTGKRNKYIRN